MSTFLDFWELDDFLLAMFKNIREEELLNFYLHKTTFSDISYNEFKASIEASIESQSKTEEEILEDVKNIIDKFNKQIKVKETY